MCFADISTIRITLYREAEGIHPLAGSRMETGTPPAGICRGSILWGGAKG